MSGPAVDVRLPNSRCQVLTGGCSPASVRATRRWVAARFGRWAPAVRAWRQKAASWVLLSLGLTVVSVVVLLLHVPSVSAATERAQTVDGPELAMLGGDLLHPAIGLVVLLVVAVLNVYKPRGPTARGRRRATREPAVSST